MILDANSLIDFHWLNEWDWLKDHYGLLYVSQEVFELNKITEATKESALQHLQLISLYSKEMYVTYGKFLREFKPIATADCSTLAIAKNDDLVCGTSDGKMLRICRSYGISHACTLTLLKKMIETQHRSSRQVSEMTKFLIEQRGKWIDPRSLEAWEKQILEM